MFCYPEHIPEQMKRLFDGLRAARFLRNLSANEFSIEAARFLATLNAIHPFREGNGRTQLAFLGLLAKEASHPLALQRLNPESFLAAMIRSFQGDQQSLTREISALVGR
jgi:cell filamentation protein